MKKIFLWFIGAGLVSFQLNAANKNYDELQSILENPVYKSAMSSYEDHLLKHQKNILSRKEIKDSLFLFISSNQDLIDEVGGDIRSLTLFEQHPYSIQAALPAVVTLREILIYNRIAETQFEKEGRTKDAQITAEVGRRMRENVEKIFKHVGVLATSSELAIAMKNYPGGVDEFLERYGTSIKK